MESLQVLIESCNEEAGFSLIGKLAARQHLLDLLETRFRLFDYWQQVPQIQQQEVLPQIFITGLPKSASTFLHRLLALDPNNRVPRMWEVMHPLPPPVSETFDSDSRIRKTEHQFRWLRWSHRDLVKAHPIGALMPQECGSILGYSFESGVFLDMFSIPAYESWLRSRDMRSAYEFHAKVLRHLQWQCPAKRWVLKSSDHLYALQTIMKVYPEAKFVFLHRYPPKVLQAVSSQMALVKRVFSRKVNLHELGRYEARILRDKIGRVMDFPEIHSDSGNGFLDLCYHELVSDPIGTVAAIYDCFGLPLSDAVQARMAAFATAERDKNRSDRFSLADFDLDARHYCSGMDFYCERFGVEAEEL
jgi:hypothetical protein